MPRTNRRKRTRNPNTLKRRKLYSARKAALVERLGGKCAQCGATTDLTFDHLLPRTWKSKDVHATKRLRLYAEEAERGEIQLLCGRCNSSKGAPESDDTF